MWKIKVTKFTSVHFYHKIVAKIERKRSNFFPFKKVLKHFFPVVDMLKKLLEKEREVGVS